MAFTATGASAAVVCNDEGDCWHVKDKYDYPAGVQLKIYGDDWKWKSDEKYRWHEHDGDGRGYWRAACGSPSREFLTVDGEALTRVRWASAFSL